MIDRTFLFLTGLAVPSQAPTGIKTWAPNDIIKTDYCEYFGLIWRHSLHFCFH